MANRRAEFEQALDPSDPTSNNIFENRDKAIRFVGLGILAVFVGIGCRYASKYASFLPEDDRFWLEGVSLIWWMLAFVTISLGLLSIALLRRRPADKPPFGKEVPSPFGDQAQRPTAPPPIGW